MGYKGLLLMGLLLPACTQAIVPVSSPMSSSPPVLRVFSQPILSWDEEEKLVHELNAEQQRELRRLFESRNLDGVKAFIKDHDALNRIYKYLGQNDRWQGMKAYPRAFLNLETHTLLSLAINMDWDELVFHLLESGAEIEVGSHSALMVAAAGDQFSWVDVLLQKGAQINHIDRSGRAAIHAAIAAKSMPVIQLLLSNGADVRGSYNPIFSMIAMTTELGEFASNDVDGWNAVFELFYQAGADLNGQDQSGATALHYAVQQNNKELVDWLLKHHAKIDIADEKGETPLFRVPKHAMFQPNTELFQKLLARSSINVLQQPNREGLSFFHHLLRNSSLEFISAILPYIPSNIAPDKNGNNLLHWVSHENQVKALIQAGYSPNEMNIQGKKPIHVAIESDRLAVAKAIAAHMDFTAPFTDADYRPVLLSYHWPIIEWMLEQGLDINRDTEPYTLLHAAVMNNSLEIAQKLISRGANVDIRSRRCEWSSVCEGYSPGSTPLLYVLKRNKYPDEMLKELLRQGANPNLADDFGMTPLISALQNDHDKNVIELLLASGADINAQDRGGYAPIHIALARGDLEILRLMEHYEPNYLARDYDGGNIVYYAASSSHLFIVEWAMKRLPSDVAVEYAQVVLQKKNLTLEPEIQQWLQKFVGIE